MSVNDFPSTKRIDDPEQHSRGGSHDDRSVAAGARCGEAAPGAGVELQKYVDELLKRESPLNAVLRDRGTEKFHVKYPDYGRPARVVRPPTARTKG